MRRLRQPLQLTINTFADGRKFISGNRCDKPVTGKSADDSLNLYAYKQQLLAEYKPVAGKRGSIGIPLCLGFYELLPFWWAFWTKLGFAVHTSPVSSRGLYLAGQATIPSDTACFPAKLSHGHIKALSQMHLDAIFYPCLTYNFDEGLGDNHYNCPVVAYYPEVLAGNCPELEGQKFIYDYVGIHRPKDFVRKMAKEVLPKYFGGISEKEVQAAADAAYAEHEAHMAQIRVKGSEIIDEARRQGKRIIVLAGRPYHVDPEVNHGIPETICSLGMVVLSEDSVSWLDPNDVPALTAYLAEDETDPGRPHERRVPARQRPQAHHHATARDEPMGLSRAPLPRRAVRGLLARTRTRATQLVRLRP